eukprot:scaffold17174_cov107-Isochrysis_galbana.AAC.3
MSTVTIFGMSCPKASSSLSVANWCTPLGVPSCRADWTAESPVAHAWCEWRVQAWWQEHVAAGWMSSGS